MMFTVFGCLQLLKNLTSDVGHQCRKQKDLYLWMAKCPNGPSVKFLVNAGMEILTRCSWFLIVIIERYSLVKRMRGFPR